MSGLRVVVVGLCLAAGAAVAATPPFGTLLQQWDLPLSGSAVGAGLCWRGDSARIYLIDQGYSGGQVCCRSFRPEDPVNTIRDEGWQFPDLGSVGVKDVPQGVAWDSDSGCYWVSSFIDNNSGNCCLLRMSETGVWTGDSWALPCGDFVYVRGIDRSADMGTFFGGGSWSTEAGLARFDPYAGLVHARAMKGSTTAAGCVPADSNYLITTRGSYLMKLSSAGAELESVRVSSYVPYDLTVVVPDAPQSEDTVCFYAITRSSGNTLQRMSTGMIWDQLAPGSRRNVRPNAILAPTGAPDSGTAVTPRVVVRNIGVEAADLVRVWFKVDHYGVQRYLDSARIANMPARSVDTVDFAPWVVNGRDSMTGVAWVYWTGDSMRRDDTIQNRFLARMRDAGVRSVLVPSDTLDSGEVVVPQASVWNFGNARESIPVSFVIKTWTGTGFVFVSPGGARTANATTQYTAVPGAYIPRYQSMLPGDMHPGNDAALDTFWVRGAILHDVAVYGGEPQGAVDTTMTVAPACSVSNLGIGSPPPRVWCTIRDRAGVVVYAESAPAAPPPGDTVKVAFPSVRLRAPGQYVARCSTTAAPEDQNMLNDYLEWAFDVVTGVSDGGRSALGQQLEMDLRPSVTDSRRTTMHYSLAGPERASLRVCDVAGRTVARTDVDPARSGRLPLDLTGLSAGVYIVRLETRAQAESARLVLER